MKLKVNDIENWYFTSDPHYYHEDIIKYCHRPFDNIQHQHEVLINNWNNKVPVDGKVVMAGDFALTGNIKYVTDVLAQLNGNIYWILGNHVLKNLV